MSENSNKSSVSLAKGIFRKVLSGSRGDSPPAKKRGVVERVLSGFMTTSLQSGAARGVAELNKDGYRVYNLPGGDDIFVSSPDDSTYFEDEVPALVRIASGDFISREKPTAALSEDVSVRAAEPSELESMFVNAMPRAEYGEVNFGEVIIKSSLPDDTAARIDSEPFETVVAVPETVMEIEGLYGSSVGATGAAVSDGGSQEISFMGTGVAETAVTAEAAAPMQAEMPMLPEPAAIEVESADSAATVADPVEIRDVVMDMLKLTVPSLDGDARSLADFPPIIVRVIPDDGLERLDAEFKPAPSRPAARTGGIRMRPTGVYGSSLNFSF